MKVSRRKNRENIFLMHSLSPDFLLPFHSLSLSLIPRSRFHHNLHLSSYFLIQQLAKYKILSPSAFNLFFNPLTFPFTNLIDHLPKYFIILLRFSAILALHSSFGFCLSHYTFNNPFRSRILLQIFPTSFPSLHLLFCLFNVLFAV